jgi:hypothetical protein
VEGFDFDEAEFFPRISESGARALLIGRRALVVLGLPVLTADYDFWVHGDDAGKDLIATKRFAGRPKDSEDIRLLESLRRDGGGR